MMHIVRLTIHQLRNGTAFPSRHERIGKRGRLRQDRCFVLLSFDIPINGFREEKAQHFSIQDIPEFE